jgi:hypothetical protein
MPAETDLRIPVRLPGEARPGMRAAFAIMAFLSFAVAIPLVLWATSEAVYNESEFFIRYSVLLYSAFRMSVILWRDQVRPVAGVFWMFVYICLGVVPLAQLSTGASTILAVQVDDATLQATTAITLLGCISFDLAYHLRLAARAGVAPGATLRSMDTLRIFAGIAVLGGLVYVAQVGGISVFFASRQEAGQALDQVSPDSGQAARAIISAFGSVACLVGLIFYIHAVRMLRSSLNLLDSALMVALVGLNVIVNNPISNSRYWTLAVLFGLIMPLIGARKSFFNLAIIGGVVAAIFLFPLSDITRRAAGTGGAMLQSDSVWRMISTKDYDQFSMLANTLGFTRDEGFTWGNQFLGALLFWVPRVLWPTKPLDSGVEVGLWMNSANVNLSSPMWAEAWINFGVAGVIVTFAVLGLLSRKLDSGFGAGALSAGSVGYLGVSIFSGYMFILLRGSLLQSMGRLMILALAIAFLSGTVKRKPGDSK